MPHYPMTGITSDSREVEPGFAFVAIPGERADGHDYIEEAIVRGAKLIITEREIKDPSVPVIKVNDSRWALSQYAASFYNNPAKKLKTIGITGTNGKSTTASILHHLLSHEAGLISTVESVTGTKRHPPGLTTPDAVKIHSFLRQMITHNHKYAVLEVSSHGIDQKRVAHIDFQLQILTGISADHLDYHRDFKSYLKTKGSFFTDNRDGIALFNRDDPYYDTIVSRYEKPFFTYGTHEEAHIRAIKIVERGLSSTFTIQLSLPNYRDKRYQARLPLPGRHNIYNGLGAFGGALLLGKKPGDLLKKLRTFPGVWRRMQCIKENGFTIIDDCAHNPGSYRSLFSSIQQLSFKKIFLINAIRGNRGVWINRENAKVIGEYSLKMPISSLLITSAEDITDLNDQVKEEEKEIFLKTLAEYPKEYSFTSTLQKSLVKIKPEIKKGDLLLLVGAHAFDRAREVITKEFS